MFRCILEYVCMLRERALTLKGNIIVLEPVAVGNFLNLPLCWLRRGVLGESTRTILYSPFPAPTYVRKTQPNA